VEPAQDSTALHAQGGAPRLEKLSDRRITAHGTTWLVHQWQDFSIVGKFLQSFIDMSCLAGSLTVPIRSEIQSRHGLSTKEAIDYPVVAGF
jgi:hypothetical protein